MKIRIANGVKLHQVVKGMIDLSQADFSANYSLKGIKPFELTVAFDTFTEVVETHLSATVVVTLECAYTLEHFEQEIILDEELCFNFTDPEVELESDDCFYEKGPDIELDHYAFALILSYIPLKVVKPGATLPTSGTDYDVLTEEEFSAKKQTVGDEFDNVLSQLDVDDE
jgi:uncharacterized metal-binding protein YceD (DUF177 family)